MVKALGVGIAEAQYELDMVFMKVARMMAGYAPAEEPEDGSAHSKYTGKTVPIQHANYYVGGQAQQPAQIKLNIAKRINLAAGIETTLRLDAAAIAKTVVRPKTRLNVLATNIGSEVDAVNKALANKNLPYASSSVATKTSRAVKI